MDGLIQHLQPGTPEGQALLEESSKILIEFEKKLRDLMTPERCSDCVAGAVGGGLLVVCSRFIGQSLATKSDDYGALAMLTAVVQTFMQNTIAEREKWKVEDGQSIN